MLFIIKNLVFIDSKAKEQEILLPTARISSSPQQIVAPIGDRSSSTSDSKARQAIRHIIAGGFAGVCSTSI